MNFAQHKVSDEICSPVEGFHESSETEHLLKSHLNVLHLARSIEQFRIGLVQAGELVNAE